MEHRVLASCVLVALSLLTDVRESSQLSRDPPTARSNKQSERTILFPETNVTEHSLPVFPDPVVSYVGRQQPPLAPPTDNFGHPLCVQKQGDTFCEKVDNYPQQEIRKAINYSTEEFVELFGTMAISSRKSGDLDEDTVCKQQSRIFYPRAAVNENDQWAFVVNDVDYIQTVMAEICENPDGPCPYLSDSGILPLEHTATCRQKFSLKRLLALNPNGTYTYVDNFKFPSCCQCFVKKEFLKLSSGRGLAFKTTKLAATTMGRFPMLPVAYYQSYVLYQEAEKDEDEPCRFLDGALPWDVTSKCRQKFAYKRLLALHPNKKKTYTDAFRFPSCCICYVKKPFIMTRTRAIEVGDKTPAETSSVRQRNPRKP